MRIIFQGLASHAVQLLHDLEQSSGVNGDYRTIVATMTEMMPSIKVASFSGDVRLPASLLSLPIRPDFSDYLRPTMYIDTDKTSSSIRFENTTGTMNITGILDTVVAVPGVPKTDGIYRFDASCAFKSQQDFRYNSLEFCEQVGVLDREKGAHMDIEVEHAITESGLTVLRVRVTEKKNHGRAYRFAQALAKRVPNVSTLYYSLDLHEGWEVVREGWDWDGGNPRILTEEDYRRMEELERQLKPYKQLIMPYLQSKGWSKGCHGASYIFGSLEDIYLKGVRDPVLATNLAIVLGNAGGTAFATMLMPLRGAGAELDKRIPEQVINTAEEVARQRIGIKSRVWRVRCKKRLPSPSSVSETVLWMLEKWQDAAALKQINDEFSKQYGLTV